MTTSWLSVSLAASPSRHPAECRKHDCGRKRGLGGSGGWEGGGAGREGGGVGKGGGRGRRVAAGGRDMI